MNKNLIHESEGFATCYEFEFNTPKDNYVISLFGNSMRITSNSNFITVHGNDLSPITAIKEILLLESGGADFVEKVSKNEANLEDYFHYNNFDKIYK